MPVSGGGFERQHMPCRRSLRRAVSLGWSGRARGGGEGDKIMAKLNVVAIIYEAFVGAFIHFGEMVRIVWVPVLIWMGLQAVFMFLPLNDQYDGALLFDLVAICISMFVWSIIAVAWHRFIVLGERTTGAFYFRFGRREARFLVVSILLVLLIVPSLLILWGWAASSQSANAGGGGMLMLIIVAAIAFCVGIYYMIRLCLLLPAVAIDQPVNVRAMLSMMTGGNFWRLLVTFTLLILVMFVIDEILVLFATALNHLLGALAVALEYVASIVVIVFLEIVSVAILSIAYRELSGGGSAPPAPQSQQP